MRRGGRTARTGLAVYQAVDALLRSKEPSAITMVEVAQRAGVAATSLYRRWGDVGTLLTEVAVDRLMQDAPLPDTGSLKGDLTAWARWIAVGLAKPGGSAFFRVYVSVAPRTERQGRDRAIALHPRLEEIASMLARADIRGEASLTVEEVADFLIAPLYMRALFGAAADELTALALVDRLLERAAPCKRPD